MNRPFTPRLGPAVLKRLEAYADRFHPHFNHPRQALWSEVYLRGLIQEGRRKLIEPLSGRVSLPAPLATVADPEQALQPFVSQSRGDEAAVAREYRAAMAEALADPDGVFVRDDTTFPKQGRHSVGVRAPARRGLGQEGQWPMRRVATLRGPRRPRPSVPAAFPAARLVKGPDPAGPGRGASGGTPGLNQGPDRPGAALAKRAPKAGRAGGWWPMRLTGSLAPSGGHWKRAACITSWA
jgi:hypothetical protein